MNPSRPVYILDAPAFTPAYCRSLTRALIAIHPNTRLLTSESLIDEYEPADHVPGREYFFLRKTKRMRRRAQGNAASLQVARALGLFEYGVDLMRLFVRCVRERPILHIQWTPVPLLDWKFIVLARAIGIRIVFTVHNPMPHDEASRLQVFLNHAIQRGAHRLIVHNIDGVVELRDNGRIKMPIEIIPIGVLFDEIAPVPRDDARKRFAWGDECVFLFIGLIRPYKGLDLLLDALREVSARTRLVIASPWPPSYDREVFERKIESLREVHAVEIRGGVPSPDETAALMCGADACVFPYRSASGSAPGMMAMRFGLPMIATWSGSFTEMLGEKLVEWIVAPGNLGMLQDALERFAGLTQMEREAIGKIVRLRGETEFSWREIARRTVEVYESVE